MSIMSIASEVIKLIFAVSDVSFNSGNYTLIKNDSFFYRTLIFRLYAA